MDGIGVMQACQSESKKAALMHAGCGIMIESEKNPKAKGNVDLQT